MAESKSRESYNGLLDFIHAEIEPCIMAPFMGSVVPVIVSRLSFAQIRSCGDFSLIETISDVIQKKKKMSASEMVVYAEMQYEVVKAALVSPTYDEIMSLNEYDILRKSAETEIKETGAIIDDLPVGPKRDKLQLEYDALKMKYEFLLPADFVSFIFSYALRIDETDIKLVSEDMLYEAAIRAKNGSGNPSDHLPGTFSDFNKVDINNRAMIIYAKRMKNGSTS